MREKITTSFLLKGLEDKTLIGEQRVILAFCQDQLLNLFQQKESLSKEQIAEVTTLASTRNKAQYKKILNSYLIFLQKEGRSIESHYIKGLADILSFAKRPKWINSSHNDTILKILLEKNKNGLLAPINKDTGEHYQCLSFWQQVLSVLTIDSEIKKEQKSKLQISFKSFEGREENNNQVKIDANCLSTTEDIQRSLMLNVWSLISEIQQQELAVIFQRYGIDILAKSPIPESPSLLGIVGELYMPGGLIGENGIHLERYPNNEIELAAFKAMLDYKERENENSSRMKLAEKVDTGFLGSALYGIRIGSGSVPEKEAVSLTEMYLSKYNKKPREESVSNSSSVSKMFRPSVSTDTDFSKTSSEELVNINTPVLDDYHQPFSSLVSGDGQSNNVTFSSPPPSLNKTTFQREISTLNVLPGEENYYDLTKVIDTISHTVKNINYSDPRARYKLRDSFSMIENIREKIQENNYWSNNLAWIYIKLIEYYYFFPINGASFEQARSYANYLIDKYEKINILTQDESLIYAYLLRIMSEIIHFENIFLNTEEKEDLNEQIKYKNSLDEQIKYTKLSQDIRLKFKHDYFLIIFNKINLATFYIHKVGHIFSIKKDCYNDEFVENLNLSGNLIEKIFSPSTSDEEKELNALVQKGGHTLAIAYTTKAKYCIWNDDLNAVEKCIKEITKYSPPNHEELPNMYTDFAIIFVKKGDQENAKKYFELARNEYSKFRVDKKNSQPFHFMARTYKNGLKFYQMTKQTLLSNEWLEEFFSIQKDIQEQANNYSKNKSFFQKNDEQHILTNFSSKNENWLTPISPSSSENADQNIWVPYLQNPDNFIKKMACENRSIIKSIGLDLNYTNAEERQYIFNIMPSIANYQQFNPSYIEEIFNKLKNPSGNLLKLFNVKGSLASGKTEFVKECGRLYYKKHIDKIVCYLSSEYDLLNLALSFGWSKKKYPQKERDVISKELLFFLKEKLKKRQGFLLILDGISINLCQDIIENLNDINGNIFLVTTEHDLIKDTIKITETIEITHYWQANAINLIISKIPERALTEDQMQYAIERLDFSPFYINLFVKIINMQYKKESYNRFIKFKSNILFDWIKNDIKLLLIEYWLECLPYYSSAVKLLKIIYFLNVEKVEHSLLETICKVASIEKKEIERLKSFCLESINSSSESKIRFYKINKFIFLHPKINYQSTRSDDYIPYELTHNLEYLLDSLITVTEDSPYAVSIVKNTCMLPSIQSAEQHVKKYNKNNPKFFKSLNDIQFFLKYVNLLLNKIYIWIRNANYEDAEMELEGLQENIKYVMVNFKNYLSEAIYTCQDFVHNAVAWLSVDAAWSKEKLEEKNVINNLYDSMRRFENRIGKYKDDTMILKSHYMILLIKRANYDEAEAFIAELIKMYESSDSLKNLEIHRYAQFRMIRARLYHDRNQYLLAQEMVMQAISFLEEKKPQHYFYLIPYYLEAASLAIDLDGIKWPEIQSKIESLMNELKSLLIDTDKLAFTYTLFNKFNRLYAIYDCLKIKFFHKTNDSVKAMEIYVKLKERYGDLDWIKDDEVKLSFDFIELLKEIKNKLFTNIDIMDNFDGAEKIVNEFNLHSTGNKEILIHGDPGAGKTSLAKCISYLSYAANTEENTIIWWFDFTTKLTFIASLFKLSTVLNIDQGVLQTETDNDFLNRILKKIIRKINLFKKIIFIFDNIDDIDLTKKYSRKMIADIDSRNSIFITYISNKNLDLCEHKIFLKGISLADAKKFLISKVSIKSSASSLKEQALERIALKCVDDDKIVNPLCLSLAVNFIITYDPNLNKIGEIKKINVDAIINLYLDELKKDNRLIFFLLFASFLNAETLTLSLYSSLYRKISSGMFSDHYIESETRKILSQCHGLIVCIKSGFYYNDAIYSMHRLVRASIQRASESLLRNIKPNQWYRFFDIKKTFNQKNLFNIICRVLCDLVSSDEYLKNKQKCSILVTNIQFFLAYLYDNNLDYWTTDPIVKELKMVLGYRLFELEEFQNSLNYLNVLEQGPKDIKKSVYYNKALYALGNVYYFTGDYVRSEKHLKNLSEKNSVSVDVKFNSLIKLSLTQRGMGKIEEAMNAAKKAVFLLKTMLFVKQKHLIIWFLYTFIKVIRIWLMNILLNQQ